MPLLTQFGHFAKPNLNIALGILRQPIIYSSFTHSTATAFEENNLDLPLENPVNPYEKPTTKCILCAHKIVLDYKNARLLQQFVSNFSGRVYERHITGLCSEQQKRLLETVKQSRKAGCMPILIKDPRYLRDPKLFNPMKPIRPHPYA